jgi:hypothetical protein
LPVHYPSSNNNNTTTTRKLHTIWIRRPYASDDDPLTAVIPWNGDYHDNYVGTAHVLQPASIQLAISIGTGTDNDDDVLVLYNESGVKHYTSSGTLILDIPDVNRHNDGPLTTNYQDYTTSTFYDVDAMYEQAWLLREHYCKLVIGSATNTSRRRGTLLLQLLSSSSQ